MSWITGLVDKAENILDKLDENAATALRTQGGSASNPLTYTMQSAEFQQSIANTAEIMNESHANNIQFFLPPVSLSSTQPSRIAGAAIKSENDLKALKTGIAVVLESANIPNISSVPDTPRSSTPDLVSIEIDAAIPKNSKTARIFTDKALISTINSVSDVRDNPELKAFKMASADMTCERNGLRQGCHLLIPDADNLNLREKYDELEIEAQRLTGERNQVQSRLREAQSSISSNKLTTSELESNLAKSHKKNLELSQKLQMQIKETAQQRQDLEDYRKKAHRALQVKDNLINELKSSSNRCSVDESHETTNELCIVKIELNSANQELQSLREEKAFLLHHLDEARKDLKDSRLQHSVTIASMLSKEDALNKAIRSEKQRSMQLDSEQRIICQELTTLRQQLISQMTVTPTKFQNSAKPIPQLKVENKNSCADHEDYNIRIKSLTEALVDKQNCVELITADRNALRIQLEKVQDQMQQISFQGNSSSNRGQRNILLSNTTDDVKAQFPLLMKETPFDNRVARRVKRVYSSLDSAGIRLGAFLRRYPLMRIFVLMYVGLLHIWVIFVLLSSTPT